VLGLPCQRQWLGAGYSSSANARCLENHLETTVVGTNIAPRESQNICPMS
jgi:hypothetical protein